MIFVLGSINADIVVYSEDFPEVGETIVGTSFLLNQGGKGANQAVSATKSGGDVLFIGRIGKDFFGDFVIEEISKSGVKSKVIIDDSASTGVALINVNKEGKNKITIIPGANWKVSKEELDFLKDNIKKGDVLLIQGELATRVTEEAAEFAKSAGACVIFDPTPVKDSLKEIIPYTTFLTPNEVELKKLTSGRGVDELFKMGAKSVILKLGEKGAIYKSKFEEIKIPAFPVDVVDTTGAGDIFNGAFASKFSSNASIKDSLLFASAAATISVTRKGAAVSSPYKEEIEKFLERCER